MTRLRARFTGTGLRRGRQIVRQRGLNMQRYGMVLGVKEEKIAEYKELHAAVWPEILDMISECNIRNYSIYLKKINDAGYFLFSYFEYVGDDYEADMKKMADDPNTQKWWDVCMPCQEPITDKGPDEWWANMEEVFHWD